jgi:hypothetical protein
MRRGFSILTLALIGAFALLSAPVFAQYQQQYPQQPYQPQPYQDHRSSGQFDQGIFYDNLSPYGDWVEMPDYGWSFAPRVDRNWRPYTRGQWVMTDDGWFWDSDEQFGWATYHYGRWVNDRRYGWVWVPGNEWAPAWVSWRHGDGYTGWAPLPPRATWQTHVGLNIGGLDIDAFIGSNDYNFVQDRSFVDRGIYQRVLPPTRNVTIINQTTNITNYTVVNQRVVNGGIPVDYVERTVGRSVPRARTVDSSRADAPRHARAGEVAVFRPEVRAAAPDRRPVKGTSLVKGDALPPQLAARSKEREQEQKRKGNAPELTAKDVEQRRPAAQQRDKEPVAAEKPQAQRPDPKATQQETQRQHDQARQEADQRIAKEQAQQAADRKLAQDKAQQDAARQRANQDQQRLDREKNAAANDQKQRDQDRLAAKAQADKSAQQDAARQRANQDQQRLDREKNQANDPKPRDPQPDPQRADREKAPANEPQPNHQPQVDPQHAKRDDPQAEAGKPVKDAQQLAKDNAAAAKEKSKKKAKPSPTPPPVGQQ